MTTSIGDIDYFEGNFTMLENINDNDQTRDNINFGIIYRVRTNQRENNRVSDVNNTNSTASNTKIPSATSRDNWSVG